MNELLQFLESLKDSFDAEIEVSAEGAAVINRRNGNRIEITELVYTDTAEGKPAASKEYIVCFATQHRHFEDAEDAADYIGDLLTDSVLPIEFYTQGKACFGGDLLREEWEADSAAGFLRFLCRRFGCPADFLQQTEYEIRSWSGRYDTGRKKTPDLNFT